MLDYMLLAGFVALIPIGIAVQVRWIEAAADDVAAIDCDESMDEWHGDER